MPRLTKSLIEKTPAPPPGKETWLRDTELKGFAARISPNRSAHFYLAYKEKGLTRKVSLGGHELLTVDQAREKARLAKAAIKQGIDCKAALGLTTAAGRTVADLAVEHQAVHKVKASTKATYQVYWDAHIVKALGHKRLEDLSALDVIKFHQSLKSKTSANRAVKCLSKAINDMNGWSSGWPKISNPCFGIKKHRERPRKVQLKQDEAAALYAELEKMARKDHANSAAWFCLLLIVTGLRSGEWRTVEWNWIDLDDQVLRLPDTKANRHREVPLSQPVIDILERMPRRSKWLFPNADGSEPMKRPRWQWSLIKKAASVDSNFRMHDIRRMFASNAHTRAKLSVVEVGGLLGHSQVKTTSVYLGLIGEQERTASKRATASILKFVRPKVEAKG